MNKKVFWTAAVVAVVMITGCGVDVRGKDVAVAQEYCAKNGGVKTLSVSGWSATGDGAKTTVINAVVCNDGAAYEIPYTANSGRQIIPPPKKIEEPRRTKVVSKATRHANPVPMPQYHQVPQPCCVPCPAPLVSVPGGCRTPKD